MMLMVISNVTNLLQSFIISFINVRWELQDDVQPCLEKDCQLQECINLKASEGKANGTRLDFPLFLGFRFSASVPRAVLNMSLAGYLQLSVIMDGCSSLRKLTYTLVSLYRVWKFSIHFITYMCIYSDLIFGTKTLIEPVVPQAEVSQSPSPSVVSPYNIASASIGASTPNTVPEPNTGPISSAVPIETVPKEETQPSAVPETALTPDITCDEPVPGPPSSPKLSQALPLPASVSLTPRKTGPSKSTLRAMWQKHVIPIIGFVVAFGFILAGVLLIVYQAVMSLGAFISTWLIVDWQTRQWEGADPLKPCPWLWKDGLEDLLWIF